MRQGPGRSPAPTGSSSRRKPPNRPKPTSPHVSSPAKSRHRRNGRDAERTSSTKTVVKDTPPQPSPHRPTSIAHTFEAYLHHRDTGSTTHFQGLRLLIAEGMEASNRIKQVQGDPDPLGAARRVLKHKLEPMCSNELFDELCVSVGLYQFLAGQPLPDDTRRAEQHLKLCEHLARHMQTAFRQLMNQDFRLEGLKFAEHGALLDSFQAMQTQCRQARHALKGMSTASATAPTHEVSRPSHESIPVSPDQLTPGQSRTLGMAKHCFKQHFSTLRRQLAPFTPYQDINVDLWEHIQSLARQADPDQDLHKLMNDSSDVLNACTQAVQRQLAFSLVQLEKQIQKLPDHPAGVIAHLNAIRANAQGIQTCLDALESRTIRFWHDPPDHLEVNSDPLKKICVVARTAINGVKDGYKGDEGMLADLRNKQMQYRVRKELSDTLKAHPLPEPVQDHKPPRIHSKRHTRLWVPHAPQEPRSIEDWLVQPEQLMYTPGHVDHTASSTSYVMATLDEHVRQVKALIEGFPLEQSSGIAQLQRCRQSLDIIEEAQEELDRRRVREEDLPSSHRPSTDLGLAALRAAIVQAIGVLERSILL